MALIDHKNTLLDNRPSAALDDFLLLSDDLFWQLDTQGNLAYISPRVETLLAYSCADLIGQPFINLIGADYKQQIDILLSEALNDGLDLDNIDVLLIGSDGAAHSARITTHKFYDDREMLVGLRGYCRDITALAEQQRALSLAMRAVETTAEQLKEAQRLTKLGNWVYLRKHKQLICSPEMFNIYGLQASREPDMGYFKACIHKRDLARVISVIKLAIKSHNRYRVVHQLIVYGKRKTVEQRGYAEYDRHGSIVRLIGTVQDITDSEELQRRLGEQEQRYQTIFNATQQPLMLVSYDAELVSCNQATASLFNFPRPADLEGQSISVFSPEFQPDGSISSVKVKDYIRAIREFGYIQFNWTHLTRDQQPLNVEVNMREVNLSGQVYLLASLYDLRERERMSQLSSQLKTLLKCSSDAIMITANDTSIISVNPMFTAITGYERHEVIGKTPSVLSSGDHSPEFYKMMWAHIHKYGEWAGEINNRRKTGEVYPQYMHINRILNQDGQVSNYLATFHDKTESNKTAALIEYLEHYDVVTGLHNIDVAKDKLARQITAVELEGDSLAVCCLNIDGFRRLIGLEGYEHGDLILKGVAQFLIDYFVGDLNIARLNADSFVFVRKIAREADFTKELNRLQALMRAGISISGSANTIVLTSCIGVAVLPSAEADASILIRDAEVAMKEAKRLGVGKISFYRPEMTSQVIETLELERALFEALKCDEFELYFQPKVQLGAAKVCCFEALIRWRRDGKIVMPGAFMPTVESTDLVNDVTFWVIESAVKAVVNWREQGILGLKVSINVSSATILSGLLPSFIAEKLQQYSVSPALVGLEILENVLFSDPETAMTEIGKVRDLGVKISLDDFGTGFSSLSYLQRFPIDVLKIDRSFINKMDTSSSDLSIVRSTIAMAHSMGLAVVAEGVETDAQIQILSSLNCDLIQGYRIAKPMSESKAIEFFNQHADGFEEPLNGLLHHSVLIVDDSADSRQTLRIQLESLGFCVIEAENGTDGLAMIETRLVSAVIADFVIPSMDGVEFLEQVKANYPDVKRVLISSSNEQDVVIEAINRAGINGFLPKPWCLADIEAALK